MVRVNLSLCLIIVLVSLGDAALAQQISAPEPQTGTIIGTVIDENDGIVPGATIVLEGRSLSDHQRVVANDNGFFQLDQLNPGIPYHITVNASGFAAGPHPKSSLGQVSIWSWRTSGSGLQQW
jgi:hypothetical protein